MENNVTYDDFINNVKEYIVSESDLQKIRKAYYLADYYHNGQMRDSGEPYIIHPLNVAYILSNMHADSDTLCAALLHDTLEDTSLSKEEIEREFNSDVLNLVDGVTKIRRMNFSSKEEQHSANTRKIINGLTNDVRIIIIKLADRLHNMRTLEYKKPYKQKENALETLEVFSPIAYSLGCYKMKNELEDLSLRYLKPDDFQRLTEKREQIKIDSKPMLEEILHEIDRLLSNKEIHHDLRYRVKNIYGIYKRLAEGANMSEIHDLFALKVLVDNLDDCYRSLGVIHQRYFPINSMFKDYVCNPKTNLYQSLHTTIYGSKDDDKLVQMQIRTPEMDLINTYGIMRYFDIHKENSRIEMQKRLKNKYQFYNSLVEINKNFSDNDAFIKQAKSELFSEKVYITTSKGVVELPKGATCIDLAYSMSSRMGDSIEAAIVNDEEQSPDYVLHDKDRVTIITNENNNDGPKEEWADKVKTAKAKRKILENGK